MDLIWDLVTSMLVGIWIGLIIGGLIVQGTEWLDAWRKKRAAKRGKAGQADQGGANGETQKSGGRGE
jgi:hypothetical protein